MYKVVKILFLVTLLVCLAVLSRTQTQAVCLLTDEVTQQDVTATFVREADHLNYLTIVDEDGDEQVIETTDSHPFWVISDDPDLERGARDYVEENGVLLYHEDIECTEYGYWVEAKDLQEGDVFIGANGELSTLIATERVEFPDSVRVYNFTVDGNHNYYVIAETDEFGQTSILVHNSCTNPYGKLGSPAHRSKIAEIAVDIDKRGYLVDTEHYISTPNSLKRGRFADVVAIDRSTGDIVEVHQVGKSLADGVTGVAREHRAMGDIRQILTDALIRFHAYDK